VGWRVARVPCVIATMFTVLWIAAPAWAGDVGKVRFVKEAQSSFDAFTDAPSPAQAAWMRQHFWRQKTYAPYFDSRTSWYPDAWTYKDLYAIYADGRGDVKADQHPSWVLKDAQGHRLYIPYGCDNGACSQFAGDPGNPAFRAQWIAVAKQTLAHGYRGLFVDDVNLEFRVGNGQGKEVAPIDPRTGKTMTFADWRRYVAEFVEEITAAVKQQSPALEVAHNPIWFSGHSDPSVQRELLAADYVNLERGVNDDGLQGGGGQFGLSTFLAHIDWLHEHGKGVVMDSYADTRDAAEYNLATYFLIATERDGLRTDYRATPKDWWSAYDADLGDPQGGRYEWNGLLRRDFANGFVVVNPPGHGGRTIAAAAGARAPGGDARNAISLPGAGGRVVLTSAQGAGKQHGKARHRTHPHILLHSVANPRVTSARSHGRARASRRLARAVRIRGRLRGMHGGRVAIALQRRVHGHWKRVRYAQPHLHDARFARVFRHLPNGTYRVRARHRMAPDKRATRATRRFQIRR
jgi:hypothetical protein